MNTHGHIARFRVVSSLALAGAALFVLALASCDSDPAMPEPSTSPDADVVSADADAAQDMAPEPTCDDGHQNGDEEGVDCGGSTCEPCPIPCTSALDCVYPRFCHQGFCIEGTCNDGIGSLQEAGVDCGGPCPVGCPEGSNCFEDSDCAPPYLCFKTCVYPTFP